MTQHQLIIPEILDYCPKLKEQELKRQLKQKEDSKNFILKQQQAEKEREQQIKNLQKVIRKTQRI